MRALAFLLAACVAFPACGHRVKVANEQRQDGSNAERQKSQDAGNATNTSHSLDELEQLQSNARARVPNASSALKLLALLLLAVKPADSFAFHKSRLFSGRGQFTPRQSRPEAGQGHNLTLNKPNNWHTMADPMRLETSVSRSGNDFARENAQAQESNLIKLMQLPREDEPEGNEKFYRFSRNADPTLRGTLGHLQKAPSRFQRRSPVMSSAVLQRPKLELERAPPAPPPPPRGGGGGGPGGEDDGGSIFLRKLSTSQADKLLDDWIARTRVFCMSGQFGKASDAAVAEVHRKSLQELEVLSSFNKNEQPFTPGELREEEPVLLALYASDKTTVLALSGGFARWQKFPRTLEIKYVAVNPVELNKESSSAASMMKQGLRLMADALGAVLTLPGSSDDE